METSGFASNGIILDWLAGTFLRGSVEDNLTTIKILFGEIVELDRGMFGYDHSGIILGSGRVAWSSVRPDMGVYLSLPSKALGELKDIFTDIPLLLDDLRAFGMKFTRLDTAIDDTEGLLSIDEIDRCVTSGECIRRFAKVKRDKSLVGPGDTIYFGKRSSDTLCRIYDKRAERLERGVSADELPDHWIRVEFEFKRENAEAVASKIIAEGESVVAGLIRGYLDFRQPTADQTKTRWPSFSWWQKFLDYASRCTLGLPKIKRTIEDVKDWLFRQVAPSLALVVEAEYGCVDSVYKLIDSGRSRFKERHIALLACT